MKYQPHNPDHVGHRLYLAAALTAAAFSDSRRAALVGSYDTWDQCIDASIRYSEALYDRWRADGFQWGEDYEQYDVLDRIAEFWHAIQCYAAPPATPAEVVDLALEASKRHDANRAAERAERDRLITEQEPRPR